MASDDDAKSGLHSRRSFLTGIAGAGATVAGIAGAGLSIRQAGDEPTAEDLASRRSATVSDLTLQVNDKTVNVSVPDHRSLLLVLREDLGLTGTKEGCGEGECGACTVLVDGQAVVSCLVPFAQVDGRDVRTIEGADAQALQRAFMDHIGAQCGICTPGMIMAAVTLLEQKPKPSEQDIREGISGNFCRCTGYQHIVNAIQRAAGERR